MNKIYIISFSISKLKFRKKNYFTRARSLTEEKSYFLKLLTSSKKHFSNSKFHGRFKIYYYSASNSRY